MRYILPISLITSCCLFSACGQKGALYYPPVKEFKTTRISIKRQKTTETSPPLKTPSKTESN